MSTLGIDPTRVTATAEFLLGQRASIETSAGTKEYIYVKDSGSGITGAGYVCDMDVSTFYATMTSTTTTAPGTGAGKPVGVARAAFTASYYGWLQIYGAGTILVGASCAAYTLINSTGTAGALDDDASAGAEIIAGVTLDVACGGGGAAATAGWLNYPRVDRTL
jgi:hypothetical protein